MRFPRQTFERLRDLLRPIDPDPAQDLFRLKAVERDVILPIKALYLTILVYYFYFTPWAPEPETAMQIAERLTVQSFGFYLAANVALAVFFLKFRRVPLVWGRRLVFVMSVLDSLFLAAIAVITGGFDSVLYWLFLGLIVRNAVSFPTARIQIILNVTLILSFVCAGLVQTFASNYDLY